MPDSVRVGVSGVPRVERGLDISPWKGCCPAPLDTPVRFRVYVGKKSIDFDWSDGRGGGSVHQYDSYAIQNQQVRSHTFSEFENLGLTVNAFAV